MADNAAKFLDESFKPYITGGGYERDWLNGQEGWVYIVRHKPNGGFDDGAVNMLRGAAAEMVEDSTTAEPGAFPAYVGDEVVAAMYVTPDKTLGMEEW